MRSAKLRAFFARYIAERGGTHDDPRIEQAFAAVPRELFAGDPPWSIGGPLTFYPHTGQYTVTPDDDPAFLYQDILIALDATRGINIGEPGFHAFCLARLAVREGERVLHVGAGSGYYTAILAELTGPCGRVDAYEIEPAFAARAQWNLADRAQVSVHARSGTLGALPVADAIYVNAACVRPSEAWLQALAPGGRLLFPLQKHGTLGGMLLVQRPQLASRAWPARIVTRSIFVDCVGLQDEEAGARLAESYAEGMTWRSVRSLRFDAVDHRSCWLADRGWWLSLSHPEFQDGL